MADAGDTKLGRGGSGDTAARSWTRCRRGGIFHGQRLRASLLSRASSGRCMVIELCSYRLARQGWELDRVLWHKMGGIWPTYSACSPPLLHLSSTRGRWHRRDGARPQVLLAVRIHQRMHCWPIAPRFSRISVAPEASSPRRGSRPWTGRSSPVASLTATLSSVPPRSPYRSLLCFRAHVARCRVATPGINHRMHVRVCPLYTCILCIYALEK
jgi:hypothetical protein